VNILKSVYKANILKAVGSILILVLYICFVCTISVKVSVNTQRVNILQIIMFTLLIFFTLRWLTGFLGRLIYVISIDYTKEKINFSTHWFRHYNICFHEIQQIFFDRGNSDKINYVSFYKSTGDKGEGVSLLLLSATDLQKVIKELKDISKKYKSKITSESALNSSKKTDDIAEESYDEE
jgi:hypothetical protein